MSDISVLGIFVADISFSGPKIPSVGETILGNKYNVGPGGKGCNPFNCGIGLLIFVDEKDKIDVLNNIKNVGYDAFLIGSMEEKNSNKDVYFEGWGF